MATYDFDLTAICEKPKRGALPTPEAIPKMKAEKLAKCLKDYGRAHPNVANAVFLRAAELTESEDDVATMCDADFPESALAAVNKHSGDTSVAEGAMAALAGMVRHKAGAEAVVTFGEDPREAKGISAVVRVLEEREAAAAAAAARLLGMLVMVAPPLVLRADVPRKLAKAMAKAGDGDGSLVLHQAGCKLLRLLVMQESQGEVVVQALTFAGVFDVGRDALVRAMATHPSDVDVNTQACVGLTACVRQMAPEERTEFAKRAVPVIVAAVGSRMVDPNLMGAGLMTLSILCRVEFSGPHGRQLALSNGGVGIAAAKNAMVNCKGMAAVQKEGIALLCSLVEANDLVGRHGVLQMCMPPFLFAMRAHKDDDNVQLRGATLLAGLASGCEKCRLQLATWKAPEAVAACMEAKPALAQLQFACCHVLMLMAQEKHGLNKCPQAVVAVDAVPALLVAAARTHAHWANGKLFAAATAAIAAIAKSDDKGREAVLAAGAEAAWLDAEPPPGSIAGSAAGRKAARAGRDLASATASVKAMWDGSADGGGGASGGASGGGSGGAGAAADGGKGGAANGGGDSARRAAARSAEAAAEAEIRRREEEARRKRSEEEEAAKAAAALRRREAAAAAAAASLLREEEEEAKRRRKKKEAPSPAKGADEKKDAEAAAGANAANGESRAAEAEVEAAACSDYDEEVSPRRRRRPPEEEEPERDFSVAATPETSSNERLLFVGIALGALLFSMVVMAFVAYGQLPSEAPPVDADAAGAE